MQAAYRYGKQYVNRAIRYAVAASLWLATCAVPALCQAQLNLSGRTVGGGVAGSAAARSGSMGSATGSGLTSNTGQVQAAGALQRSQGGFVGASSQSAVSLSDLRGGGASSGPTSGFGTTAGLGGLGGLGALGGLGRTQFGLGLGGLGRTGIGGFGQMGQLGQPGNLAGQAGNRLGQQTQMRIPVRLGFTGVRATPASAATQFQTRLARIPALAHLQQVEATVEGSTLVLRGYVTTEHEREVLERVARLEPGIDSVRNELQVQVGP